jgi:hypothetical protein
MKTIKKIFLLCSFFYFLTGNAQAPEKMSFQAVIRNASNVLVSNHSIGMKISILQSSTTGTPVYVETQTPTSNSNGLVTIQIGAGTAVSGSIMQINWSSASFFIKTEVDPTGGTNYTISTVSQLLSVPYALFAKTASSATDNNAWKKTGNSNIDPTTQFIGTTDDNALQFKVNNEKAGIIETSDITTNTVKNGNTAFGYQSLNSNTTGEYNVANGHQSLNSNTTGKFNIAIGGNALYNNTDGNNNVANGDESLFSNTTGHDNVANGSQSLYSNTVGNYNVAVGNNSLYSNTTANYNIATGEQSLYFNTIGNNNIASGFRSLYNNTIGNSNTAIGNESGKNLPSGVNNVTCLGSNTGWNTTSSNQINIGDFSVTSIGGQVNWGTYSDKRIKTDVKENVPGLAFIKQLTPVTYHLDIKKQYELAMNGKKDESKDYPEKYDIEKITQTGFLAQDVETASKNVGYNFSGVEVPKNGQGLYKLRYAEFVVPLVQAVKELSKENEELKARLKALEDKVK